MYKLLFLFLLGANLLSNTCTAQMQRWTLGVRTGTAVSWGLMDKQQEAHEGLFMYPSFGALLGGQVQYHISPRVSLELGLAAVWKGYKYVLSVKPVYDIWDTGFYWHEAQNPRQPAQSVRRVHWELPFTVAHRDPLWRKIFLRQFAGVAASYRNDYLRSYTLVYDDVNYVKSTVTSQHDWNVLLIIGAGMEFRLANRGLFYVGMAFRQGLLTQARGEFEYVKDGISQRNQFSYLGSYASLDVRWYFGR